MVANVVGRLLQHHDQPSYRRRLAAELSQHPWLRLLPALADLPLELRDATGAPAQLADALARSPLITLAGPSGGGRQLALLQHALRWAADPAIPGPPPVLVHLPQLAEHAAPDLALGELLRSPGADAAEPRAFFRRSVPDPAAAAAPALLLVYGIDELPEEQAEAWRAALQRLAVDELAAHLVVALAEHEPAWPGFTPLTLAPVSPGTTTGWVEHLTPPQQRAAVLAAVAPRQPLQPLGERLFELALLVWLAPQVGLPGSRSHLYTLALARLLEMPPEQLGSSLEVAELQLLAAYDERPTRAHPAMVASDSAGRLFFRHPQLRRYLAARQLLSEDRIDLLGGIAPAEQAELALLLNGMLVDPLQLYPLLWQAARTSAEPILTLGRCLREREPSHPAWALRVIAALAQLAGKQIAPHSDAARALLATLGGALERALRQAIGPDPAIERFLGQLFQSLPADLAEASMLQTALHPGTPEPFGWQVADWLLERGQLSVPVSAPLPADALVLARWIYLQALHPTARRQAIDPDIARQAIEALARSSADDSRKLFAATALAEDGALAPIVREAAVELLAANPQPNAMTVIERASDDPAANVRRAALTALYQRDPSRGEIALGRAAIDRAANWELRYAAIQSLGGQLTPALAHLLAQCVGDTRLPLFARLNVVDMLSQHQAGPPDLLQLLNRGDLPDTLRAEIARALGAAGYAPALRDLLRLLAAPAVARTLIEGCCAGLGALGQAEAVEPLLELLERSYHDPALTLATVRALGQLGDPRGIDLVGRLVGAEALQRLQRNLAPRLLQLPIESCLDNDAVPPRLIEQLADVLANAITPEVRPTSLGEFLASEADRVRVASAGALLALGGNGARAALLAALLDDTAGGATAEVIAALAELDGPESADVLAYLLEAGEVGPLTRWMVVQQIAKQPAGEELLQRGLANTALEPFTRGALAEALGQRHAIAALPLLRQLAEDHAVDTHLRSQAILSLGLLSDPSTETTLLRIVADEHDDETLRGLAADYLPEHLSPEGRRALRELLRGERPPVQLLIGALRTLGRVRDRESLPLILRFCQDITTPIVQAAVDALADMGDASVAPVLVRISQQGSADHALRLQAVGALLKIGGDAYQPLLRSYLQQGPLPFRLLALEALIGAGPPAEELHALLADPAWPTPLRLRLLEYLASDLGMAPLLAQLLTNSEEVAQLRAMAAETLGLMRWQAAEPALIQLAQQADASASIRLRCVGALRRLNTNTAWVTLSRLAEDEKQPSVIRNGARAALRHGS